MSLFSIVTNAAFISSILYMAGGLILQMGVAGPCDILVSSAGMNPSLKGVATFSADYLS